MGVEERSLARDALVSTLLLAEPPAVKLLADAFRIVVRQDFVPKPESWPQLLPLLHSGVQTRYDGLHTRHTWTLDTRGKKADVGHFSQCGFAPSRALLGSMFDEDPKILKLLVCFFGPVFPSASGAVSV